MNLLYRDGCTCTSLAVDGKETIDMPEKELQNVIHKLVDNEQDISILQNLFMTLMESQGTYEHLGHCSECGDDVFEFSLTL